jgi:hypothetical protein
VSLTVTFVRHRERRDRIFVEREDGSQLGWSFPSYGDRLPHDLCHLVVEHALGITDGFWGLVERGADVALVDNEATLVRDGTPLVESDVDFSGLLRAEDAVALMSGTSGAEVPAGQYESVRARLSELTEEWCDLDDGGAITLTF